MTCAFRPNVVLPSQGELSLAAIEALSVRCAGLSARRHDRYIVEAFPLLAEVIAAFIEDWNVHHPQIAGQWGLDPDAPIPLRGTEWLAIETGLPEKYIQAIRRGHVTVVELVVFDRLSAALDAPDLIHDQRVHIMLARERTLAEDLAAAL